MIKWNSMLAGKNFVDPNILVLLVGKSGTGKTTLEKMLVDEHLGFKSVKSYTTRPKRTEDEDNHIFVSKEEFDALENKVGYTKFNGYEYCATKEQLDNATIYVIDPSGVEYLKNSGYEREMFIVYLDAYYSTCESRMLARGDNPEQVRERILNDHKEFRDFDLKRKYDVMIESNADADTTYLTFVLKYALMRLNNRINELESEVEEWKNLSQRLP